MKDFEERPGASGKKTSIPSPLPVKGEGGKGRGKRGSTSFIRHLAKVGKKKPQLSELMRFYQELLNICAQNPPTFSNEAELLRDKIFKAPESTDPPLLLVHELTLEQEAAENLFGRLCVWLAGRPRTKAEAGEIAKAWQENKISRGDFFCKALRREENYFKDMARSLNLNASLLYFLAFNCVRPAVEILSARLRLPGEEAVSCSCPLCGSGPAMAELRTEEGRRYFCCAFCGSEWPGLRMICPYCQNQDQDKLGYFTVEGEPNCWVYVCELCKKYIKTRDSRQLPAQVPLLVEDLITPHLDILAARQGYQRGAHNLSALEIT